MTTHPQERDIVVWLRQMETIYSRMNGAAENLCAKQFKKAADEITRLRAQPSPREVALEREIENLRDFIRGVGLQCQKAALSPAQKGEVE